jgi:hypothetical protein
MTDHTAEPWAYAEDHAGKQVILYAGTVAIGVTRGPCRLANARRLVACVNHCAGLETEVMELLAAGNTTGEGEGEVRD